MIELKIEVPDEGPRESIHPQKSSYHRKHLSKDGCFSVEKIIGKKVSLNDEETKTICRRIFD